MSTKHKKRKSGATSRGNVLDTVRNLKRMYANNNLIDFMQIRKGKKGIKDKRYRNE